LSEKGQLRGQLREFPHEKEIEYHEYVGEGYRYTVMKIKQHDERG